MKTRLAVIATSVCVGMFVSAHVAAAGVTVPNVPSAPSVTTVTGTVTDTATTVADTVTTVADTATTVTNTATTATATVITGTGDVTSAVAALPSSVAVSSTVIGPVAATLAKPAKSSTVARASTPPIGPAVATMPAPAAPGVTGVTAPRPAVRPFVSTHVRRIDPVAAPRAGRHGIRRGVEDARSSALQFGAPHPRPAPGSVMSAKAPATPRQAPLRVPGLPFGGSAAGSTQPAGGGASGFVVFAIFGSFALLVARARGRWLRPRATTAPLPVYLALLGRPG